MCTQPTCRHVVTEVIAGLAALLFLAVTSIATAATYYVHIVCHAGRNQAWNVQGRMRAKVAGQSVENELIESKRVTTPTMNPGVVDLHSVPGTVEIDSPGAHSLGPEIASDFPRAKPEVRSVMLVPTTQNK